VRLVDVPEVGIRRVGEGKDGAGAFISVFLA
jgi:hypothetical protein